MHCWLWPSLGFWMLANEHAPRHSFPLAPAVAGFAVLVWHAWDTGRLAVIRWLRPVPLLGGACVLWLAVKIGFVAVILPMRAEDRQARHVGDEVATLLPKGTDLHHSLVNCDESILFYCVRPAIWHRSIETPPRPDATYWFVRLADWNPETTPGRILGLVRNEAGQPAAIVQIFGERIEPEPGTDG